MAKKPIPEPTANPPVPTHAYPVEEYSVGEFVPEGSTAATEVHLSFKVANVPFPVVIRLKSAAEVDRLEEVLRRHRTGVWGVGL